MGALTRRRGSVASQDTAFPTQQLFVLALCRICEPIAFMSIFPYIYYMISSFHITTDERRIAIFAGMVTSAFAFAEFSTGVIWGRLSDRIGRKPVLLGGLAGTALSMTMFGFATNLPMALLGRALGGLLNGNIGVLQTTVAELVTAKEHQPRAYSIMPFVWCLGSIIGPALGGALAQPCLSYPTWFPTGTIFDRYPFLLPNLVCTVVLVIGVCIGILFLQETHPERKHQRDRGLEVGRWLLSRLRCRASKETTSLNKAEEAGACFDEVASLMEDIDPPPGYRTTESSPVRACAAPPEVRREPTPAAARTFTRQVITIIIGYGILAYHTISFDQLMPVFLSSSVSHTEPKLPFEFTGGFGLSSKTIGILLSIQGLYSLAAQLLLFPFVARRWGALRTFRTVVLIWPLLYMIVPYVVLLPPSLQIPGVMFCLLWRITAQVLAFPSSAILLANSAPTSMVLGLINGVAASTASLSRAFGPTVSGFIHACGLRLGYGGLAWWVGGAIALLGAMESFWVEEPHGRLDVDVDEPVDAEKSASDLPRRESCLDMASVDAAKPTDQADKSSFSTAIVISHEDEDEETDEETDEAPPYDH